MSYLGQPPSPSAGSVNTDDIVDGEVNAVDLSDGAVSTSKIQNNAVTTTKINNGAVTTAKLDDGSVTTDKIADDSITFAKLVAALIANQSEAEAGIATNKLMTPEQVSQAIAALTPQQEKDYEKLGEFTVISSMSTVDIGDGLDLDVTIDDTYVKYVVEIEDLYGTSSGAVLYARFRFEGSGSFDTASNYKYLVEGKTGTTDSSIYGASASQFHITPSTGDVSTETSSLTMNFYSLRKTDRYKKYHFTATISDGSFRTYTGSGEKPNNNAVDAIRFLFNTGTIEAGTTFRIYGVR